MDAGFTSFDTLISLGRGFLILLSFVCSSSSISLEIDSEERISPGSNDIFFFILISFKGSHPSGSDLLGRGPKPRAFEERPEP